MQALGVRMLARLGEKWFSRSRIWSRTLGIASCSRLIEVGRAVDVEAGLGDRIMNRSEPASALPISCR